MPLRLSVTVKPQSKQQELKEIGAGQFVASVRAPAREGKANQELIELLAHYFSVPKSSVRITQGQTGRRKLIEIG